MLLVLLVFPSVAFGRLIELLPMLAAAGIVRPAFADWLFGRVRAYSQATSRNQPP